MTPLAALGLGLLAVAAQAAPAAGPERREPRQRPAADGAPVEVAVVFYALDFARITSREESFDCTGYLELSWQDPALAFEGAPRSGRRVDPAEVWTPRVYFENALEQPRFHADPLVEVDPSGRVTSWAILSGKFSSPMDLRRFPFDRQVLRVRVGSFEDADAVRFRVKDEPVLVGDEAFITDWEVGRASASVDAHAYSRGRERYPRYAYELGVVRRSTFYVWRVLVPLTLLAVVSWAAFWFDPVGLQPQISTCTSALISLVAFNFAIDFSLPKVAYLTLVDKHALMGFGFVALAVEAVTVIHVLVTRDRLPLARAVQRGVRWGFLPAYGAAVVLNLTA